MITIMAICGARAPSWMACLANPVTAQKGSRFWWSEQRMIERRPVTAHQTTPDAAWWHKLEIRDLRCFIALAEEMHFGRAARRLNLAQPALSRKIARLEADFGGKLFDRTRAQIKLTAAGLTLLPRARDVLQRVGTMAEDTRRVVVGKQGLLEIGFVSSATFSILPKLVGEY